MSRHAAMVVPAQADLREAKPALQRPSVRAVESEPREHESKAGTVGAIPDSGTARPVEPPLDPRDFASLNAGAAQVNDADAVRALVTRALLEQLAPALGLDPRRIRIQVDQAAAARTNAAGASGLQQDATIHLHPGRYQPQTERGRYLLAHELTHAAQRGLSGPASLAEAELEAAQLGHAFARGEMLRPPRRALRAVTAADMGAEQPPPTPTVEESTGTIDKAVAISRSREIAEIKKSLSGLWVSDGDVFDIMRILDSVSFAVANAMVRSLEEKERYWLADNINPPHVYKHRRSVLLSYYQTLSDKRLQDAVDLKVFRALSADGMSTEETEAARYVLQHLKDDQRRELLESDNGAAIKCIVSAPKPSAEELARIQQDAAQDAADETRRAADRKEMLAQKDDPDAKSLLERVRRLLSPSAVDDGDLRPSPYTAVQALTLLTAERDAKSRFSYVAEQMEQEGLIDQLLEMLPSDSYFDDPDHTATLQALVQSRLPYKTEKLIESLLSYGFFDWAIRDYEAAFAYKLVKALPLADQYKFRLRDSGKWYLRLLEHLPKDQKFEGLEIRKAESQQELDELKTKYKGLVSNRELGVQEVKDNDGSKLYYNASQLYEAKLERDPGAKTTLDGLIADFKDGKKGGPTLYRELVELGGSSLEPGHESPGDELLRESVIQELDRLGYIDKLFDELNDKFLFAEWNRISTVKIMLARDPARAQRHARGLVSYHFTDWMVTDKEAYLAYLVVKALPADEREAFIADNPKQWDRIKSEMSESMRQSRDLNLYIGDKAGTDRASVLGQLAEADTWTTKNYALLNDLLRMAMAMTEHRYAFERSKEFNAAGNADLLPLVDSYRLWHPKERPEYKPEILKGTRWYEEGIFAELKTLWAGLVTLWNLDVLFVENKVGLKVDLNDIQNVTGGDVGGVQLGDPHKRGAAEKLASPDANKLTLLVGTDGKSAELILPELVIDSANVQMASSTFQTGQVNLNALHIKVAYDQPDMSQPSQAEVSLQSVVANDLLLAKSSTMFTVTRLAVRALRLAAGTVDTISRGSPARKGRSVPFPLLVVPMLALFMLLALPVFLYKKISGLINEGLESNNEFVPDVAARTKAISFTLDSLDVDSITTSGGQHVGHAGIRDLAVRVGLNKATRLRAELASINQRLGALQGKPEAAKTVEKLKQRKSELEGRRDQVEQDELKYLQLQRRILKGGVPPNEQADLQQQLDALNFEDKGGAFIDIGAVEASDIKGTLSSAEPIRISNIHGEGGNAALAQMLAPPTATTAEFNRRLTKDERPEAPLAEGQEGKLEIELGDVHTGEISIGGGLRGTADIDKKLQELDPLKGQDEIKPLYESLQLLRKKAERYELMVRHGVSALTPPQLDEFRTLRQELRAQADLIVKSIDLTRAHLDVDVASGRIDVGADAARITGIQLPGKGITIDEVAARGLGVGALPKGGLLNWKDWKKNLKDADGKIDELQISGVRSKYHGLLFEKATLTGAYAKMRARGDLLEAGLKNLSVEGVGVAPRIGLLNQRLAGLKEKARLAPDAEKAKLGKVIAKLESHIADLQALAEARVAAYRRLEAAKTPQEIEAAEDAVAESDTAIALGLAQYGASHVELDDFGVRATGAGDVLSDVLGSGLDVDRILRRGVRVQGIAGEEGGPKHLLRRFKVTGGNAKEDQADSGYTGKGDFELGETQVNLKAQRGGADDSVTVDLDQFTIASLSMSQMLFTADNAGVGLQIGSTGTSGLENLRLSGHATLKKSAGTKGEGKFPQDFYLAHVDVDDFRVGTVRASGLSYTSYPDQMEVTIKSGSIEGIWARQVHIDLPEEKGKQATILGSAGIDQISDVDLAAAMTDGMIRHAQGRISGSKIQVDLLKEGEVRASVGDLNATAFAVRGPDGWARFSLSHFGTKLSYKNGVLDIKELHLGSFEVPAVHWKIGPKGFVEADQPVSIKDVQVAGRVETSQVPAKSKPGQAADAKETQLDKIKITRLHVGTVEAKHLVYQDDNNHVEIGPSDATLPKHMKGFQPLLLKNLDVWDLNWERGAGVSTGHAKLEKYEASASVSYQDAKDLKAGLKAGIALTGGGMTAEVSGPGVFGVDIGKIEKIRGIYNDQKIDTKFGTGQVTGKLAFGPDYIEASGIEVKGIMLGKTSYKDPPRELGLHYVMVDNIKLGKVRQNYAKATDPAKPNDKTPGTLEVENLEVFDVHVDKFTYKGQSTGKNKEGKDETSKQEIEGKYAEIQHLKIGSFVHDAAKAQDIFSLNLDSGGEDEKVWSPLRVRGLAATFTSTVGGKDSTTKLATDIEGGPLTADNIKFATVKVGKLKGADGKDHDVTRTAIDGSFNLTRLGLINPDLTMTDADGKITKISAYDSGSLELQGLRPRFLPNGTMVLPFDAVIARNLQIQRGSGGEIKPGDLKVQVPFAKLKDLALGLKGLGTAKGMELLAAKCGELSTEKLTVTLEVDRTAPSTGGTTAAPKPEDRVRVDPLGGAKGAANIKYHLPVIHDPQPKLPIENGIIDFGKADWPYYVVPLGVDEAGLYFEIPLPTQDPDGPPDPDPPPPPRVHIVDPMKGFHPGAGNFDRGTINLQEVVESLINDPADPNKKKDPPAPIPKLNNLTLWTEELTLGGGRIGTATNYVDLVAGSKIVIPRNQVGELLQVELPSIAGSAGFQFDNFQGKALSGKGEVEVKNLVVMVHGLANLKFTVSLYIGAGTIRNVTLGDVSFLDADPLTHQYTKLQNEKAPAVTDVAPENKP